MPRFPSFYCLGALAGAALWLVDAPTPFPFLGLVAMIAGTAGFALSLAYIASYEPERWRAFRAAARRFAAAPVRVSRETS